MAALIALEEDDDDTELLGNSEDEAEFLEDDISDILDLVALDWMEVVRSMAGDGSRRTYNQIPKSADFFSQVYRVIEALLVLHNMAIDLKDKPDETWLLTEDAEEHDGDDGDRDAMDVVGEAQVPAHETDLWLKEEGRKKRIRLLNHLF
ncbi:hypothetical protein C8R46DRAFT_1233324 [Mycena filopes]|nr:hypothetical protein C8R46DRAFT_1233324 [Mycena filopes]